jgi:hypothetical protein
MSRPLTTPMTGTLSRMENDDADDAEAAGYCLTG